MGRTVKTDISGRDFRVSMDSLRDGGVTAAFAPDLAPPFPLVVEIGFGRGEFLLDLARQRPDAGLLGIECMWKRVMKMARRLALTELGNVRLLESRAELAVAELLLPGSVSEFWVNFPDPWPKKRHAKHRLIQPPFVRRLAERLAPGGLLHLATDDVPYAEQMHEVLSGEDLLENLQAPRPWVPEVEDRLVTAYESLWRAEGRNLHFFAYRRPRAGAAACAERADRCASPTT